MDKLKWNREFALEQAADDIDLLQELLEIFKNSSVSDFEILKQGIEEQNAEAAGAAAHSIKGAAASLGIEGVRNVAMEIEMDCKSGSTAVAEKKKNELDTLLQLVQEL